MTTIDSRKKAIAAFSKLFLNACLPCFPATAAPETAPLAEPSLTAALFGELFFICSLLAETITLFFT
jgi:hypothetical protein